MTMLTDEQAAIAAARKYAVSLDQPKTNEYHIRVDGFVVGARFARNRYEARLAEDAKVRAQLVEALEAAREWMIEEGCDCGVDEPESCALCLTVAALAAAKGIE